MAIVDTFIGNLRAAQNIARGTAPLVQKKQPSATNIPKDIDKPTLPDDYTTYHEVSGRDYAQLPDSSEYAENATRFSFFPRISVTDDQYYDFMNNKNVFSEMMGKWAREDSPQKRSDIVRQYSQMYNFYDNAIFADLIDDLSQYDYGNEYDEDAPADAFTPQRRKEWWDAFEENMKAAQDLFNPRNRQRRA